MLKKRLAVNTLINQASACNDRGVYLTITLTQGSMAGNFTA